MSRSITCIRCRWPPPQCACRDHVAVHRVVGDRRVAHEPRRLSEGTEESGLRERSADVGGPPPPDSAAMSRFVDRSESDLETSDSCTATPRASRASSRSPRRSSSLHSEERCDEATTSRATTPASAPQSRQFCSRSVRSLSGQRPTFGIGVRRESSRTPAPDRVGCDSAVPCPLQRRLEPDSLIQLGVGAAQARPTPRPHRRDAATAAVRRGPPQASCAAGARPSPATRGRARTARRPR